MKLCGSLDGRGVWGRMDTCMCMNESLQYTEDKMVGWHHQLNGHEFEQASEVGNGQGSLACCSKWGRKALDMTE